MFIYYNLIYITREKNRINNKANIKNKYIKLINNGIKTERRVVLIQDNSSINIKIIFYCIKFTTLTIN